MKVRLLTTFSLIYILALTAFSFYWASNFSKHVHIKGDDFFVFAEIILVWTYIFYIAVQLTVKRMNVLLTLLVPVLISVAALLISAIFLLLTRISGIPKHYILTYGIIYIILSIYTAYQFWWRPAHNP